MGKLRRALVAAGFVTPFAQKAAVGALCCLAVVSAVAVTWDQIGGGVNTFGSMACGTGCTILPSGSGVVRANEIYPTNATADLGRLGAAPSASPTFTGTVNMFNATIWSWLPPVDHAASAVLAATDCLGQVHTNTGAGAAAVLTLPAAVVGTYCTFVLTADKDVELKPNGADQIIVLTAAGGNCLDSPAVNRISSSITLWSPTNGFWMPMGPNGTWTDHGGTCP